MKTWASILLQMIQIRNLLTRHDYSLLSLLSLMPLNALSEKKEWEQTDEEDKKKAKRGNPLRV